MSENQVELLFFDTFAHDSSEEINLDLVQFPKPVYVVEVRIIPLGARVQADFPGGVRLGATNPTKFKIEFFVNDLGKPGASTFEALGSFEYDQNGRINLECTANESQKKIATDGLVLRGLYTTITLAVYGTLTSNLTPQIVPPVANSTLPNPPNAIIDTQNVVTTNSTENSILHVTQSQQQPQSQAMEYSNQASANYQNYTPQQPEPYQQQQQQQDYPEYYNDTVKDPRNYHHQSNSNDSEWEKNRNKDNDRNRDRHYSPSQNSRQSKEREKDNNGDKDGDNKERRDRRSHDDGHSRQRYRDDREDRKRPKSPPPLQSPKRQHASPPVEKMSSKDEQQLTPPSVTDTAASDAVKEDGLKEKDQNEKADVSEKKLDSPSLAMQEENSQSDVVEFEPILSDEDIVDDGYQDIDYDYSAYTNNDDIIKLFIPGVTELQEYPKPKRYHLKDNIIDLDESLRTAIAIADDYLKSSITKYSLDNFVTHSTVIKEEFVHLCEKLIGTIGEPKVFIDTMEVFNLTRFTPRINMENHELAVQTAFIIETITDWLKIAMNYEMANAQKQPAYKIRHIKSGIRLAEWLAYSDEYIQYIWHKNYHLDRELLDLFHKKYMALSIKLMILKSLDRYLLHKFSIENFLVADFTASVKNDDADAAPTQNGFTDSNLPVNQNNGYKILVQALRDNPLVRIRFAISSILKKLNLYEVLMKMYNILIKLRSATYDISVEEINLITKSLDQILNYCNGFFSMSQPKRFLPVAAQFEINCLVTENYPVYYFKMFNVLQCFLLLLTYHSTMNLPPIKTPIFEIVSQLLEDQDGLNYLAENSESVNLLLKCLLRSDEEIQYNNDSICIQSHNLGLNIACKLQSLYHIQYLLDIGRNHVFDCDTFDQSNGSIIEQLHGLLCLTFSSIGKMAVSEVLGMGDNIKCLLQFFDGVNLKSEANIQKLKQSVAVSYVIDLIHVAVATVPNVRLLEKYNKSINNLLNVNGVDDESLQLKINELKSYLTPFDSVNTPLNYENVIPFLTIIERHIDNVISQPCALITSLRILQYLGISKYENKDALATDSPFSSYIELKYKHVILQLFSSDAINILVKLLQKICDHYHQPSLHSSIFVSKQGLTLINIIHPAILLLNQMLAYVIQCRNTEFKDLTAIPALLQTYNFLNSVPVSAGAYKLACKSKVAIIETLLVYTQPVTEKMNEKDSLSKTLWSQMCGEVIKFVTHAPYTFVSGLLILSELLPLPLPIQTRDDLPRNEVSWIINLRKLWSAHLHPHGALLQSMINKLCISTQPQLLHLLKRICVQISDLAANSALIIAKGILDTVYHALKGLGNGQPCTSHIARLLNFLACLVTYNTIKCTVLYLFNANIHVTGSTENKYSSLIQEFEKILKLNDSLTSHVQAQECVLSIIQSFCDVEITLLQNTPSNDCSGGGGGSNDCITSEKYLANALPTKEYLTTFITAILTHLEDENSYHTYLPIIRTLLLLTEHDYGFYHLREILLKKNKVFIIMLNKLMSNFWKPRIPELLTILNTLIEFLKVCLTTEEHDVNLPYRSRTIKFSVGEIKKLIDWESNGGDEKHPFLLVEDIVKKATEEDANFHVVVDELLMFLKQLRNTDSDSTEIEEKQQEENDEKLNDLKEIILPNPETLLVQYNYRVICSSSDACDERLTDRYWLATPTAVDESEGGDIETIPCDLFEICRQLPSEFNILKEVEKLCRISRTETPNIDKITKPNVEQRLKVRKPFITPMRPRGFPRTPVQRPDLFRSRPPNTSRPPSLHVDDFVALETCGAQPTGPTGYNKMSREILASTRMIRGSRGRSFVRSERGGYNRQMSWWGAPLGRGAPYF